MESFTPSTDPVANSVALSALVALLPLLTFFLLLAFAKTRAYVAGAWALLVALAVGVFGFGMPLGLALLSATQGAAFGLFPVVWIIVMAVWLYQVTVLSGRFEDLRRVFDAIGGGDLRVQAILVAFCFGGLLEALAGFGAPVAITVTMLLALGIAPIRAASAVLVANTAPVAFGALAIPITTAANLTGYTGEDLGSIVGRQTPVLALFVPLILLFILDGRRGLRDCWPVALFTGVVFSIFQFLCSNYFSYELTDIVSSLVAMLAAVGFLRFWHPRNGAEAGRRMNAELQEARASGWTAAGSGAAAAVQTSAHDTAADRLTPSRAWMALFPYVAVIVVFGFVNLWTWGINVPEALAKTIIKIPWPVLHDALLDSSGQRQSSTIYSFEWLISPGTLLLITGLIVTLVYSRFNEDGRYPLSIGAALREIGTTAVRMRSAALTILAVLALAYVMNFSGQTVSIGTWLAATGSFFAFLSPVLGWIGTAVTGSDTSANALFAKLQQTAGIEAGLNPQLLVAANTGGGVMGKLISPQNLAIGAAAVNMSGQESVLLRKVVGWSALLLLAMCILVYLQSTPVLEWMLP
ncbi:L-lactate permease [Arthrobacter sp. zg-Y750]|uniref:L-lactate permease n=1 Tax=Arthrobacter sp. zg-Y750 TaxID=2894189 RepID=UPI001E2EBFF3|nr:L-lactate permease [Arthrobacter sp. zg-Y750]MCC9178242.1 L-lactate permease [Arthrobacter sp. zg-Y750]